MELSVLCDCEVAVIVMNQGRLYEYCNNDRMDDLLAKYSKACTEPHERRHNTEFLQRYFEDQASGRLNDEDEHVILEEPILPGPNPLQQEAMKHSTEELTRVMGETFGVSSWGPCCCCWLTPVCLLS